MQFITPLQGDPHSSLTPLFLVHAVSGLSSPYLRLGRLGDDFSYFDGERMVYGIASPIFGNRAFKAPSTLQELAARYVDAVRAKQPHGPYLLGGWSMGGMLAIKMADLLLQDGEQVLKVMMIDSANPETLPGMDAEEQKVMGDLIFARNLGFTKSVSSLAPAQSDSEASSESDADVKSRPVDNYLQRIRRHIALGLKLMSAVPEGAYLSGFCDTHVVLVKCAAEEYLNKGQFGNKGAGVRDLMRDMYMGWDAAGFAMFETIPFSAAHDTAFDGEFTDELTGILNGLLDVE
jgi:pimeloyl-ACP methyl ester carboxylesterase